MESALAASLITSEKKRLELGIFSLRFRVLQKIKGKPQNGRCDGAHIVEHVFGNYVRVNSAYVVEFRQSYPHSHTLCKTINYGPYIVRVRLLAYHELPSVLSNSL